ncbi:MAG TPA: hypothetical protein PKE29_06790 [Phycisphaerales bacterium]|nr:hypothetical protein [Phycisphaerales bacterium]
MPEDEYEPEDLVDGVDEEDDDEDEGDDEPTTVFVAMTPGRDADEAFKVIAGVCDRLGMDAQRVSGKQAGAEALYEAIETSDFAIIDASGKRPSLAEELDVVGHELDPAFVLLIARAGSPRLPELEGRTIHSYADKGDLRAVVERHLNTMIDAWHEGAVEDDGDDDEE